MTSNIGVKKLLDFGTGVGFKSNASSAVAEEQKRDVLKKELSKFFAPEFLNRIDDVIIFNSLQKEDINFITKLELDILFKRVKEKNYNFTYSESLIEFISKVGFDETYGARPIKRAIQENIEDFISEKILMDEVEENKTYNLIVVDDKVEIEIKKKTRKKVDK